MREGGREGGGTIKKKYGAQRGLVWDITSFSAVGYKTDSQEQQ